jgi:alcohol dehydrogenase class IV
VSAPTETVCQLLAPPVVLGAGASAETGHQLARLGVTRALVVTDAVLAGLGLPDPVVAAIRDAGIEAELYAAPAGEPTLASMTAAAAHAAAGDYDGFVGVGGGSALDTVKVCALAATHGGELLDYVNPPIGGGRAPAGPLLPVVALPTTAGTGSEVTAVAILDVPEHRVKTGIAHAYLRPRLAICDPELTIGCPPAVTAAVGLDALMHAVEAYTSVPFDSRPRWTDPGPRPPYQGSNPLSDVWVERAIELAGRYLRRAVADGTDLEARQGMLQCATFAGIGFGNAGVHVPHACSYPIAGMRHDWSPPGFPGAAKGVPHGVAVILTASAGLRLTAPVLPERHRRAAELLTGERVDEGDVDALPRAIETLIADVGTPSRLSQLGFTQADLPDLVAGALKQERLLKVAPLPVGAEELERVFHQSM